MLAKVRASYGDRNRNLMPEIKHKAITYLTQYACDECSEKSNPGCLLNATGKSLFSYPQQYEYQCPNCEKIFFLNEYYPKILFENTDENKFE